MLDRVMLGKTLTSCQRGFCGHHLLPRPYHIKYSTEGSCNKTAPIGIAQIPELGDPYRQMPSPLIKTSRLVLREVVADDAPALLALYADREHMQWYGIEPFPDLAAAESRIRKLREMGQAPNPATSWAVELAGDFIGTCGLFAWNRTWRKCSVGYELTKTAQGHGYMQEAARSIVSWGFREMELNRVEAQTHPNNKRSIGLLGRLGFTEEGRLRQAAYWAGQYHDMLQFSLLRAEWNF